MAEFTADTSQMEALAQQIKSLSARTDELASRVHSTGQKISGIKSLKDKGFVSKVDSASKGLRNSADEVGTVSSRITKVSSLYSQYERQAINKLEGNLSIAEALKKAGISLIDGLGTIGSREKNPPKKSNPLDVLSGMLNIDITDLDAVIKYLHKWRAKEGSAVIRSIYAALSDRPGVQTTVQGIVNKYNGKITRLEDMLSAVLHPTNRDALLKGVTAFGDETVSGAGTASLNLAKALGNLNDFSGAKKAAFSVFDVALDGAGRAMIRADELSTKYDSIGRQKIASGDLVGGIATSLGGNLIAFGDAAVDVSVRTLVTFFRKKFPVVDGAIKATNVTYTLIYNESAEDMFNSALGSIGTGIRNAYDKVIA